MKKTIKVTAILMAVIILAAFTDVPKKHWAYSVVEQAQTEGIVKGVSEKLFEPDRNISRQEVALMLYRVHAKYNAEEDISAYAESYAESITAAGIAAWAAPELAYGFENGYWKVDDFEGDGSGLASREMIARWTCSIDTGIFKDYGLRLLPYEDTADIDPSYYSFVDTMYVNGIMQGTDAKMFNAKKSITRAETAAVTVRALNAARKESKYIESHPFKYQHGVLSSVNDQTKSFMVGDVFANIKDDAEILINGHAAGFSELSLYENKKLSVSQYLLGDNINTVWIQSDPLILSGTVESCYAGTAAQGLDPYEVISINVDGISVDFIKTAASTVLGNIIPGNVVQFITDGIYLQEIK